MTTEFFAAGQQDVCISAPELSRRPPAVLVSRPEGTMTSVTQMRHFIAGVVCIAPFSVAAVQAQVAYAEFEPSVIRFERTEPVLFMARLTSSATRVALERNGVALVLDVDGTSGDATAGDQIYTLTLPATELTQGLQADDVFRPFVGFLNVYQ